MPQDCSLDLHTSDNGDLQKGGCPPPTSACMCVLQEDSQSPKRLRRGKRARKKRDIQVILLSFPAIPPTPCCFECYSPYAGMGRSCAYFALNVTFWVIIQAVWNAYCHSQVQELPSSPQPTGKGPFLKQGSGGGPRWSQVSGLPCNPAVFCSSSAAQPADGQHTHTHGGRDDDSDANPSWSVTLALSLSPEQTPSLSVTDTTALALQL